MGGMMGGGGDGPVMLFVDLVAHQAPNGAAWTSPDIDVLNKKWRAVRTFVSRGNKECGICLVS